MDETLQTQSVVEVSAHPEPAAEPSLVKVSGPMMALTWVTFAMVALILYKVAWKPILAALDMREQGIRRALEEAEKARKDALASEERNRILIQEAEQEARRIVSEARSAAEAGARQIREESERRARELSEETRRDIQAAAEQAREALRRETANMAIQLASRVIAANMDAAKNRDLVAEALKEIPRS